MARIEGVQPDQVDERLAAAFKEQEKTWGATLLPYQIYARRPSVFHAVRGMWGGLAKSGLIDGKREALVSQLTAKFGPLTEGVTKRVESIDSLNTLDAMLERVLTATSLEEMKL